MLTRGARHPWLAFSRGELRRDVDISKNYVVGCSRSSRSSSSASDTRKSVLRMAFRAPEAAPPAPAAGLPVRTRLVNSATGGGPAANHPLPEAARDHMCGAPDAARDHLREEAFAEILQMGYSSEIVKPATDREAVERFINKAFDFFDDNRNGVIEYLEIEKAYLEKGAGSEVFRIFKECGLGTQAPCPACGNEGPKSGPEVLAYMDLIQAVRAGRIALGRGVVFAPKEDVKEHAQGTLTTGLGFEEVNPGGAKSTNATKGRKYVTKEAVITRRKFAHWCKEVIVFYEKFYGIERG